MKNKIIITIAIIILLSLWFAFASSLFNKNNEIYQINEEISMLETQMIFNSNIWEELETERLEIVARQKEMTTANNELRTIKKELEAKKKELGLK